MARKLKRRRRGDYTLPAIIAVAILLFVLIFIGFR